MVDETLGINTEFSEFKWKVLLALSPTLKRMSVFLTGIEKVSYSSCSGPAYTWFASALNVATSYQ